MRLCSPLYPTELRRAMAEAIAKCSPEEETQNREEQATEMDMLQNIFDSKQIVVINPGTEYIVKVSPRIGDKLLLFPLTSVTATTPREVTHLPEVTLYIKYPPSYPSHTPPDCHISARWMDTQLVPSLTAQLKSMFTPSCPVVYEWIMFLQDEMVQEYIQQQNKSEHKGDKQTAPSTNTEGGDNSGTCCQIFLRSTSLVNDMEEYDKFEKFQEFQSTEHVCGVCFEQVQGKFMCQPCAKCGLLYCKTCLHDYCKSCIGGKKMVQLECLDPNCHDVLPDIYLKTILPENFYQRYIMLREKVELDSIPGMVFCPRCETRTLSDPDSPVAMCDNPECTFPFCKTCQQTWHGPGKCPALDKVMALKRESDENDGEKKAESEESRQRRIEELQSVVWVLSSDNVRQCPNCRANIQKNGGCNKMVCSSCGNYFCWMCGKAISGYEHFDSKRNKCVLFRDEDYLPPTKEKDLKDFDTLEDLEMVMRTQCPRCGRIEVKTSDNNWMHCYRCSFQYCYLCGQPCFGLYHFNEKYGCKKSSSLKDDAKLMKALRSDIEDS